MYRSLQYVIFTSCNVVVLHHILLYYNVGRRVKEGVVHCSCQQSLVEESAYEPIVLLSKVTY